MEEIHVFALAHVIRRPIIVLADKFLRNMDGEPLAPIYFGGIYLPLEVSPSFCYKSPLILAYDSSHFSPLVAKKDPEVAEKQKSSRFRHLQSKQDTVIPLVTPTGSLLPFLFAYDPEGDFPEKWAKEEFPPGDFPDEIRTLLESYMDIRWIQLDIGSKFGSHNEYTEEGSLTIPVKVPKVRFPAAVVSNIGEPEYQSQLVVKYLEEAKGRFEEQKKKWEKNAAEIARQEEELKRLEANKPVPCQGKNCTMYGKRSTNNLCSKCYTKQAEEVDTPSNQAPPYRGPPARKVLATPPSSPSRDPRVPPELIVKEKTSPQKESNKWDIILPDIPMTTPDTSTSKQSHPQDTTKPHLPTSSKNSSSTSNSSKGEEKVPPVPPKKSRPFVARSGGPSKVYSRDNIQPIGLGGTGSGKIKCRAADCNFYGCEDTAGYCSQCHKLKGTDV